jgi:hypothetical protein
MKVGFLVECGLKGADEQVLRFLVNTLRKDIEPRFTTCGSKRVILDECGQHVERLFTVERCEKVFVVWDLFPCNPEHQIKGKPSCINERKHLLDKLRAVDRPRTIMLCIRHELEAWLLADGNALKAVLMKNHAIGRIGDDKHPERHPNPKRTLGEIFKEHRGPRYEYEDRLHALQIIRAANLSKLKCAPSFARFKEKLEAL